MKPSRGLVRNFLGVTLALMSAVSVAATVRPALTDCVVEPHSVPPIDAAVLAQVSPIVDVGNLSVADIADPYDRNLSAPRQSVALRFYEQHADDYDFLVVFTTFEFPTGNATAFYNPIRNDVDGIGMAMFDNGAAFGSARRLQGYVDMAALSRQSYVPGSAGYIGALNALTHEVMHRWSAHVGFIDQHGSRSTDLLGQDGSHWSYFADTDASVLYGADWVQRPDGAFRSVDVRRRLAPLDMYVAGFSAPDEVPAIGLIRGGVGNASDLPLLGAVTTGQLESIGISQIVAAEGARVPSADRSQRDFRTAFILLKRPGESIAPSTLQQLEKFRERFQQHFSQQTGGRAVMRVHTTRAGAARAGLPHVITGSGDTAAPNGVDAALDWLEARQYADGHWADRPATALRDTVASMQALSELRPASAAPQRARQWIATHSVASNDARSWRLSGGETAESATLIDAEVPQGGWGIQRGWQSSPFDTVRVAAALAGSSSNDSSLTRSLQLFGSTQNPDGSFGITHNGRGRVASTTAIATLLAQAGGDAYVLHRQRAISWLSQHRLSGGAIGDDQVASLGDTIQLYASAGSIDLPEEFGESVRQYVRSHQQADGDWGGSIYATATAALAYARDQRANLSVAGSIAAVPGNPIDGEYVALSVVVTNTGSVPVAATRARWYDGDPGDGGTAIGDSNVPSLSAGGRATITQRWNTFGRAGSHALVVQADADHSVVEVSEVDNMSTHDITVGPPSSTPDLIVVSHELSIDPASIDTLPATVHVRGVLHNVGLAPVSAALLRVSALRDQRDTLVETTVDVAGRSSAPFDLSFAASHAETLRLAIVADPGNAIPEANELNNEALTVVPYGPSIDVEVTDDDLSIVEPAVVAGRDVHFRVRLRNRGTVDAPMASFAAAVVRDGVRETISDTTIQIGGGQTVERLLVWRPSSTGTARLEVTYDAANLVSEVDESNNAASLDFVVASADDTDLAIVDDSLALSPIPGLQGQPFSATLGIRNLGTNPSGPFVVALFDADPSQGGVRFAESVVATGLAGGSQTVVSINVADLPLATDATLFVVVDPANSVVESNETNNVVVRPILVRALPDLAVSPSSLRLVPSMPVAGASVEAQVTIRNIGGQPATGVKVQLIEGAIGQGVMVPPEQSIDLDAGEELTLTWNWTFPSTPVDTISITVDPTASIREGRRDNNIASVPIAMQDAELYATELYISPNGDGIRDSTTIVFRRANGAATVTRVDVLNAADRVVRRFDDVGTTGLTGDIVWDGRDVRGAVVPDGVYRVASIRNDGSQSSTSVVVDTNRSSALAAAGTPHEVIAELRLPVGGSRQPRDPFPPNSPATRDYVYAVAAEEPGAVEPYGIVRSNTLLPGIERVVSSRWIRTFLQGQSGGIVAYAFSPDGRSIAILVERANTWSLVLSPSDRLDATRVVETRPSNESPMARPVVEFLDATHLIAGPLPTLRVYDTTDGSAAAFRELPVDAVAVRGYEHGVYVWTGPFAHPTHYLPRDTDRPPTAFPRDDAENGSTSVLPSPDGTSAAIYIRTAVSESIALFDATSGATRILHSLVPDRHVFPSQATPLQLQQLDAAWIAQEKRLLVIDGQSRHVLVYSNVGEAISQAVLPPARVAGVDDHQVIGETQEIGAPATCAANMNCAATAWDLSDRHRQHYDPLTRTARVIVERRRAGVILEACSECPQPVPTLRDWVAIAERFDVDIDTGEFRSLDTATLSPTPDVDAAWTLLDGSRVLSTGQLSGPGTAATASPWTWAPAVANFSDDDSRILLSEPHDGSLRHHVFSSLDNLPAMLWVASTGRAIVLSGIAADRNFNHYELHWALQSRPTEWNALTPSMHEEVRIDDFLTWTPPEPGSYLIRLRVVDKAGNVSTVTASASSAFGAAVDQFSVEPRYFSPNGDGVRDSAVARYRVRHATEVVAQIRDSAETVVRELRTVYGSSDTGVHEFVWDGRNAAGQVVPEGRYRLSIDGLAASVVVDTVAPTITSTFEQPPRQHVDFRTADSNLDDAALEERVRGTTTWGLSYPGAVSSSVANFVGREFRAVAQDRAGNRTVHSIGTAVDRVFVTYIEGAPQEGDSVDTLPLPSPDTPINVSADPDAPPRMGLMDATPGLQSITIETAPVEQSDHWTVRSMLPSTAPPFDFSGPYDFARDRILGTELDVANLPSGSEVFVRAVGTTADDVRLTSNSVRVIVGQIDGPIALCGSMALPEELSELLDRLVIGDRQVVYVREYLRGRAVGLRLSGLPLPAGGIVPAAQNDAGAVFFVPRVSAPYAARVTGSDTLGRNYTATSELGDCQPPAGEGPAPTISVAPVVDDTCGSAPTNQLDLIVQADRRPRQLRVVTTDGVGAERVIADLPISPNDHPNPLQFRHVVRWTTSDLPEGVRDVRARLSFDGSSRMAVTRATIDRQPPHAQLELPAEGERICALHRSNGPAVVFDGQVDGHQWFGIELQHVVGPDEWTCVTEASGEDGRCDADFDKLVPARIPLFETKPPTPDISAFNGAVRSRLRATDWSGAMVCDAHAFYLDSDVELIESAEPQPRIGDGQIDVAVSRAAKLGLSTRGDPLFRQARLFFQADESVNYSVTLHATLVGVGNTYELVEPPLDTLVDDATIAGQFTVAWTGAIDGAPADDGVYALRVVATDDCGWHTERLYLVDVDSTGPSLSLPLPTNGAVAEAAIIEAHGGVVDPHFGSFEHSSARWRLSVLAPAVGDVDGATLSDANYAVRPTALLGRWERGQATGNARFRLRATDDFGNASVVESTVSLAPPANLLLGGSVQPDLFSPNADSRLDTTALRLALARAAQIDVVVLDSGGIALGPLQTSMAAAPGTTTIVWDGRVAGSPVSDGDYRLRVIARDAVNANLFETAELTVTVDSTSPAITDMSPSGAFARGSDNASFVLDDAHLDEFEARIVERPSNAERARVRGTAVGSVVVASLASLDEGNYRLDIVASDRAGNRRELTHEFTLDKSPPSVELESPAANDVVARSASSLDIRGTVSDENLGEYVLAISPMGSDTWTEVGRGSAAVAGATLAQWMVSQPDGQYRLRLRATDRAGNSTIVEHPIAIDGTVPRAEILSPTPGSFVGDIVHVIGSATDDHLSRFVLSVAPVAQPDHWSDVYVDNRPVDAAELAAFELPLPAGEYLLRLVVSDAAGLTANAQSRFFLDHDPPQAPSNLRGTVRERRDVVLDWTAVDAVDLAGYVVYRNGTSITSSIDAIHYVDSDAPEGRLRYTVRAVDDAGNSSGPSNAVEFLVDRTPPDVGIATPANAERVHGVLEIAGTASSDDDFLRFDLTAIVDGIAGEIELATSVLPVVNAKLAEWMTPVHTVDVGARLRLRAEDQQGNASTVETSIVIDNVPPATPTGLIAQLVDRDSDVRWNANSEPDLLGYLLYRDGRLVNAGLASSSDLRPFALLDIIYADLQLPDGTHSYVVHAIDRAGNVSAPSAPAAIAPIDAGPPHMTIERPIDGTAFEHDVEIVATSPDGDISDVRFAYRAAGGTDWTEIAVLTEAPYRVTWMPAPLPLGDYVVRAVARDVGGATDPSPPMVTVSFADLTAPAPPTNPTALADGDEVRVTWTESTTSDVDNYIVEHYHDFDWRQIATVDASATSYVDHGLEDGPQRYRVRAADIAGNSSPATPEVFAQVFGVVLTQPYTPTTDTSVAIIGVSARSGAVAIHVANDGGGSDQAGGPTDPNGGFEIASLPLVGGQNEFTFRVTDSSGNRSRAGTVRVDRDAAPSMPSGVQANVDDHSVALTWTANAEPDLLGYRVFRNGAARPTDVALTLPMTTAASEGDGNAAVDGNLATYWEAYGWYDAPGTLGASLELRWNEQRIVTGGELHWFDTAFATGSVDLQAWSGFAWVTVAQLRGPRTIAARFDLARPYRTDQLRISLLHDGIGPSGYRQSRLAEVVLDERVLLGDTHFDDIVADGSHEYSVSAVDANAFESTRSAPSTVAVGDAVGPDAVVLAGEVSGTDAVLTWSASDAIDIARYELSRDGAVVASLDAAAERRYVDHSLSNGLHRYRVRGIDLHANQGQPSNEVVLTIATEGPGIPTDVVVVAPSAGSALDISWRAGSGAAPVRYVLRRAPSAGGPYQEIVSTAGTAWHDGPLTNGTRYFYTVEATDIAGNRSAATVPVSAVPTDTLAPLSAELSYPTRSGVPVTMQTSTIEVCGVAEPDTTIDLARDGIELRRGFARVSTSLTRLPLEIAPDSARLVSPNGRRVYIHDGWQARIETLDDALQTQTLAGAPDVAAWAPSGNALYLATLGGNSVSRLLEGNSVAEDLLLPVTDVSFVAVMPDQRQLLIGAVAADGASTPVGGVWLIDIVDHVPHRIAGLDRAAFAQGSVSVAPDGRRALLRKSDGAIVLLDLRNLAVVNVVAASAPMQPQWLHDGASFVYAASSTELRQRRLTDGADEIVRTHPVPLHAFAVAPASRAIAVLDDVELDLIDLVAGTSLLTAPAVNAGEWRHIQWTASQRVVASGSFGSARLEPVDSFCIADVTVHPGTNRFDARSIDTAGNAALPSNPIDVIRPKISLPDLTIVAGAVHFLPAAGNVGESFSALVTLRNIGDAASVAPMIAAQLRGPDGQVRSVQPSAATVPMAAGTTQSLRLPLGTLSMAGSYRLTIAVDPAETIAELVESNNSADATLSVGSTTGALTLDVVSTMETFAPEQPVTGQVRIGNSGAMFAGRVSLSIIDVDGVVVDELGIEPVTALGFGAQWTRELRWNASDVAAGSYRFRAQLFDQAGTMHRQALAEFRIDAQHYVSLRLRTGALSFNAGALVALAGEVSFDAGNTGIAGAVLSIDAISPNDSIVWHDAQSLGTMLPGYIVERTFSWPTAGLAAGVYRLRLRIATNGLLEETVTSVTITSAIANPRLVGSISVSPTTPLSAGSPAAATYRLENVGAVAVVDAHVRLRLVSTPGQPAMAEREDTVSLASGAFTSSALDISVAANQLRDYLIVLEARFADDPPSQWRLVAQQGISVIDTAPPLIDLLSPTTEIQRLPLVARARAIDHASGVDRVEFRIDAGAWSAVGLGNDGLYSQTWMALADGVHQIRVRARDRWNNSAELDARTFVVDGTAPVIAFGGVDDEHAYSQPVTPTITFDDAHLVQSEARLNGALFTSGTTVDVDGDYTLLGTARDSAGNTSARSIEFRIDRIAPNVSIVAPIDGTTVSTESTQVVAQSEAAATLTLQAGSFSAESVAGPDGRATFDTVPLAVGDNLIAVSARDRAGNTSVPSSVHVHRHEIAGPGFAGDVLLPGASHAAGAPLQIDYSVSNRDAIPHASVPVRVRAYSLSLSTDLAVETTIASFGSVQTVSGSFAFATATWPLGPAQIELAVERDGAWQVLDTDSIAIEDRDAPQLDGLEPAADAIVGAPLLIRAHAVDVSSDVAGVDVRVDDGEWLAMSALPSVGDYVHTPNAVSDGLHTYSVRARDGASNQAISPAIPFTIDTIAPSIDVSGINDGDVVGNAVTPVILITDAHPGSSIAHLNGQPFTSGTPIAQGGVYHLHATAIDQAGNSSSVDIHFEVDLVAPSVQYTSPTPNALVTTNAVAVAGVTEPSALLNLQIGAFDASIVVASDGSFVVPGVPLEPGTNTIRARATDRAGNVGPESTLTVRYQPDLALLLESSVVADPSTLPQGAVLTLRYALRNRAEHALADLPLRLVVRRAADGAVLDQAEFAISLAGGASMNGERTFESATWPLGQVLITMSAQLTATSPVEWVELTSGAAEVVDRTAPTIAVLEPVDGSYHSGGVAVRARATDALSPVAVVETRVDAGLWQPIARENDGSDVFAGTLDIADGPHTLQVRATDTANNASVSDAIAVTIDSVDPLITLSGIPVNGVTNQPVTPIAHVDDSTPTTVAQTLNGSAFVAGSTITVEGHHTLRTTATDAAGNSATRTDVFDIDLTSPSVVFTSPLPNAVVEQPAVDVIGVTEPLASVLVGAGTNEFQTTADSDGAFRVDDVPLVVGTNTIRARATDRAGNVGNESTVAVVRQPVANVDIDGVLEGPPATIRRGMPLNVDYSVRNDGSAAAVQLPVRLALRWHASGDVVASHESFVDVAAGGVTSASHRFATTSLALGDYDLELSAFIVNGGGPGSWQVLDSASIAVGRAACNAYDRLFADGFEPSDARRDRMYCDSFDADPEFFDVTYGTSSTSTPWQTALLALLAPTVDQSKSAPHDYFGRLTKGRASSTKQRIRNAASMDRMLTSPAVSIVDARNRSWLTQTNAVGPIRRREGAL